MFSEKYIFIRNIQWFLLVSKFSYRYKRDSHVSLQYHWNFKMKQWNLKISYKCSNTFISLCYNTYMLKFLDKSKLKYETKVQRYVRTWISWKHIFGVLKCSRSSNIILLKRRWCLKVKRRWKAMCAELRLT